MQLYCIVLGALMWPLSCLQNSSCVVYSRLIVSCEFNVPYLRKFYCRIEIFIWEKKNDNKSSLNVMSYLASGYSIDSNSRATSGSIVLYIFVYWNARDRIRWTGVSPHLFININHWKSTSCQFYYRQKKGCFQIRLNKLVFFFFFHIYGKTYIYEIFFKLFSQQKYVIKIHATNFFFQKIEFSTKLFLWILIQSRIIFKINNKNLSKRKEKKNENSTGKWSFLSLWIFSNEDNNLLGVIASKD